MLNIVRWTILSGLFWFALCNFIVSLWTDAFVEQSLLGFGLTLLAIVVSMIAEIVFARERGKNK